MEVNGYKISSQILENFRLDGGAMFGSVPKLLWNKKLVADENNRIGMVTRVLIFEGKGRKVLVDVGIGTKEDQKFSENFCVQRSIDKPLSQSIPDVTDIILTHLHFDHAGGISYLDEKSKVALSFPNAKIFLQQKNLENATQPNSREKASYLAHNISPLSSGNLHLLEDKAVIYDDFQVLRFDGHTQGMQCVLFANQIFYAADLFPTSHHVSLPYIMGYDMCAATTLKEKEDILEQAVANKWLLVFEHDPDVSCGYVEKNDKGNYIVNPQSNLL